MKTATLAGPDREPWPDALWSHNEPDVDTVVDLGDEGLSNGDDIGDYVNQHRDSGVKIIIPPGTYTLSDRGDFLDTPSGDYWLQGGGEVGDVVVEQDENTSSGPLCGADTSGAVQIIENIELRGGINPNRASDVTVRVRPEDAELIFKHFRMPDGVAPGYDEGENGIYLDSNRSGSGHCGSARFLWCEVSGFADNGLYADGPNAADLGEGEPYYGRVIIVGGRYANNNISGIRLGNPYSTVYRARVELDGGIETGVTENYRGIRIRQPDDSQEPWDEYNVLISDCDLIYKNGPGAPVVGAPHLTSDTYGVFENCRIRCDTGRPAIHSKSDHFKNNWDFHNIHITGSSTECQVDLTNSPAPGSGRCDSPRSEPWWGSEDSTEDSTDESTESDPTEGKSVVRVVSRQNGNVRYSFTTNGAVEKYDYSDTVKGGNNDTITQQDSGSVLVTGKTGNEYGDAYLLEGEIVEFTSVDPSDYDLEVIVDDESFAPSDFEPEVSDGDDSTNDSGGDDSVDDSPEVNDHKVVEETGSGWKMAVRNEVLYLDGSGQPTTREKYVEERNGEVNS